MTMDYAPPRGLQATTFRTRARTVDHLGREQIADCPTAVSELWKNAWDAYARNVILRVHAGDAPVTLIADDGHGMSIDEFFDKWLVIGTESKASLETSTSPEDRNGLPVRPRQGQKGIGRLSSAKLGPVLLLLSRRRSGNILAALVDWRLFENPYVDLGDVPVAAGEFGKLDEVFAAMTVMADSLAACLVDPKGSGNWREEAPVLRDAWQRYDADWARARPNEVALLPSARSLESLKQLPFRPEQLAEWSGTGTALLVSEIDDTLRALTRSGDTDTAAINARERFEQTLASFVDPYAEGADRPEFDYRADVVGGGSLDQTPHLVVGAARGIDRARITGMEHQIEGTVDDHGVFRGRIRAFGRQIEGVVVFEPPKDLRVPDRANSRVGPFHVFLATMEWEPKSSTHTVAQHKLYQELAADYGGLMIFRDGLRVLPYGREDTDFFEIEQRRSKNAGRYFWNHRRMFGRIALARQDNPNLKDKAGREGFIDNVAARTFRELIVNVLNAAARRYFGSDAALRKERLPEIQGDNRQAAAAEGEKKLRDRERKAFRSEVEQAEALLPGLISEAKKAVEELVIARDQDIVRAEERLAEMRTRYEEALVRTRSSPSGRWAARFDAVQDRTRQAAAVIEGYQTSVRSAVEALRPERPEAVIHERAKAAVTAMRKRITEMRSRVEELQREQNRTVRELAKTRMTAFDDELDSLLRRHSAGLVTFEEALDGIARRESDWLSENRIAFGLYESALEAVQERIDLQTLASVRMRELGEANQEVERLNALAQLGIAVEIAAHDLADYDEMISQGLDRLPDNLNQTQAVIDIRLGVEGLTDQLRFLSPLRLSGEKIQRWITGQEIEEFVLDFFRPSFARARIAFKASDPFRATRLFERPSRVFPVFLNLVNNAIYWTATKSIADRRIRFDLLGTQVVVSDTGPGVDPDDAERIFDLFFTRKQRAGRGVGLYLARANLAAGGHTIRYRNIDDEIPLDGAGFIIEFRGLETPTK